MWTTLPLTLPYPPTGKSVVVTFDRVEGYLVFVEFQP